MLQEDTFGLGCVAGNSVEDVDEDEEEGDQQRHATRYDLWGHNKADPGHNHKQACNSIVDEPREPPKQACNSIVDEPRVPPQTGLQQHSR